MLEHLEGRGLQLERYPTVSYDDETCTFPIYTLTGKMIGFQQYRPNAPKTRKNDIRYGRYHTYLMPGYAGFWGMESYNYQPSILFLVEGIFDCVKFHNANLPAIATIGNDPEPLKNILYLISMRRKIYVVPDNDVAGNKLHKFGEVLNIPHQYGDVGEMDQEEFNSWLFSTNFERDL